MTATALVTVRRADMTLPVAAMPAAISDSVAAVLRVHGISIPPDILIEIGKNATQALFGLDVSLDDNEAYTEGTGDP